jgi:hypothetical protein
MILLDQLTPDSLLSRRDNAQALTQSGFRTAESTLATKASRGGGPPYQLYGRIPLYRWGDSLAWAQSRLSESAATTAEHGVRGTQPKASPKATRAAPGIHSSRHLQSEQLDLIDRSVSRVVAGGRTTANAPLLARNTAEPILGGGAG